MHFQVMLIKLARHAIQSADISTSKIENMKNRDRYLFHPKSKPIKIY